MPDEPEKESNGRQAFIYKITLLVIGFLLTTLAGGYLTEKYKRDSVEKDAELASMKADFESSMTVFEDVSKLMDRRMFRMRRLHDVLDGSVTQSEWEVRYGAYREVFLEWNENLNRNLAMTDYYFRPRENETIHSGCGTDFASIQDGFIAAQKLMPTAPDAPNIDATMLKKQLDAVNYCIYGFDKLMLDRLANKQETYLATIKD